MTGYDGVPPGTAPITTAIRTRSRRQGFGLGLSFWLVFALLAVLVVAPLGVLLTTAFTDSPPRPGSEIGAFTFENFATIFSADGLSALWNSALIGIVAGFFAMVIGTTIAWLAARSDVPGRRILQVAGIMPLFISSFVGAMAWSLIGSPNAGYINLFFRSVGLDWTIDFYSIGGIVFVQALYYSPYAFTFMYGALRLMNPELEEAARLHGANQWKVITTVTLPIVRPALLSAAILTFALVIEDFPIPTILGSKADIQTLPSFIYNLMTSAPAKVNDAAAMGITMLVILVGILLAQRKLLAGRNYTTVSGKGFKPTVVKLGAWRWPLFGLAMLYLLLAVVVPMIVLAQAALADGLYFGTFWELFDPARYNGDSFFESVFSRRFGDALTNSLIAGIAAAVLGVILYSAIAFYVKRTRMKARWLMEQVTTAPIAIPALVMGLALFWFWLQVPLPVAGTLVILVIAYIVRVMPQGFGGISSSLTQIDPDLEAAAKVSGANGIRAFTYVTVPLLRTSLISTALMVLILSMRELSSSIFLFTAKTRPLAVLVFNEWENGDWSKVAATSLAYCAILLVITIVGSRWLKPA